MSPPGPFWLDPSTRPKSGGMWPLGLEPAGFSMINDLLPGITNSTIRPRYYSFFSWVHWTHDVAMATGRTLLTQQEWRRRLEMIFRLATQVYYPDYVGLIGRTRTPHLSVPGDEMISLDRKNVTTAFQAAFYSSSFGYLGCSHTSSPRVPVELTDFGGVPLARAFEEGLRSRPDTAAALDWVLSDEMEIPAQVIYDMAGPLALRPVSPDEPEHAVLVDLLFRLSDGAIAESSPLDEDRCLSLGLLLNVLAEAGDEGISDKGALHRIFATGVLPSGTRFVPDPVFATHFSGWQRYQERQFEKVGLYGVWSALISCLREGVSLPAAFLRRIQRQITESEIAQEWLTEDPMVLRVDEAQEWVWMVAQDSGSGIGGAMSDLSALVRHRRTGMGERAASALVLLLLVTSLCRRQRDSVDPEFRHFYAEGGPSRWAISYFVDEVHRRGGERLDSLIHWLMGTAVIGQANRVAVGKLLQQGQYHFFVAQDEDGYHATGRLQPTDYVKYDEPRIGSSFELMAGLGLVDISSAIRITDLGQGQLIRAREILRETSARNSVARA